jgi:sulfatase modifying factor 1
MKKVLLVCLFGFVGLGIQAQQKLKIKLPSVYKYIPSGQVEIEGKREKIEAFYLYEAEISNIEYFEFMASIQFIDGDSMAYQKYWADSLQWKKTLLNDGRWMLYHSAIEFMNYPVVNLPRVHVLEYCKWLSKSLTENFGKGKYKITARLPTRAEWVWAASGGNEQQSYSNGNSLEDRKGNPQYCYWQIFDEQLQRDPESGKLKILDEDSLAGTERGPLPRRSFKPNKFGLYNMSGNVAEMIEEEGIALGGHWYSGGYELGIRQKEDYDGNPSPFVGFRVVLELEPID